MVSCLCCRGEGRAALGKHLGRQPQVLGKLFGRFLYIYDRTWQWYPGFLVKRNENVTSKRPVPKCSQWPDS